MSDDLGFNVGKFAAPLTADVSRELRYDADPAGSAALDFFAAMLTKYIGARFDAEMAREGLTEYVGRVASPAVPYDPVPYMTEAQLSPPLLALYPVTDEPSELTRGWYKIESSWRLLWVLPPLDAARYLRIAPFLRAVAKVIVDRTEHGHDPSYADDALAWEDAGIADIAIERITYGSIPGLESKIIFPALAMDIVFSERKEPTTGRPVLSAIGGTIQVTSDGNDALDVAEFEEDLT